MYSPFQFLDSKTYKLGYVYLNIIKVFGLRSNKFAKLGIFPIRCHEAYTKLEDLSNRKSLVDSLNKETKKGGKTHLYYEEDTFDVQAIVSRCTSKDTIHPVLLYIDGESYKVTEDVLNTQLPNDNLVLVIRDRSDLARKRGLKVLSEELDLYMWEANDGEN